MTNFVSDCQQARTEFGLANRLSRQTVALEEKSAQLQSEISEIHQSIEATLCSLIDLYNPHLGGHGRRVAQLAADLAAHLKMTLAAQQTLRRAAMFHDIGMLGLPREKLFTPWAELSDTERNLVLLHPEVGAAQIKMLHGYELVEPTIAAHHERWDGSGFPRHLRREAIPQTARLLAVCDTYDEMLNKPVDAPVQFGEEGVLDHLRRQMGRQFDPDAVGHFLAMLRARHAGNAGGRATVDLPVMIEQLRAGMQLARDLLSREHMVLLARGSVLREVNILRLRAMRDERAVIEPIYIVSGHSGSN